MLLYNAFSRPRPYDVTTIGRWAGFSSPSPPVAVLAAVLVAVIYTLVAAGRRRGTGEAGRGRRAPGVRRRRASTSVSTTRSTCSPAWPSASPSRSPPSGCSRPTTSCRSPTGRARPRTSTSTGRRGEAIRQAVHDQLGITVIDVKPVGLEGSGGSTPLRLRVEGDPAHDHLFAKLFAMNHVRADRWYKLGRQILYGRLEDETRFSNVRRLVEYEDYALAAAARRRHPDRHAVRDRRDHARARVPPRHQLHRRRRARSATPRSTTRSSTRASSSSAACGTPAWPIATSSPPTCSSATARSS